MIVQQSVHSYKLLTVCCTYNYIYRDEHGTLLTHLMKTMSTCCHIIPKLLLLKLRHFHTTTAMVSVVCWWNFVKILVPQTLFKRIHPLCSSSLIVIKVVMPFCTHPCRSDKMAQHYYTKYTLPSTRRFTPNPRQHSTRENAWSSSPISQKTYFTRVYVLC